MRLIDKDALLEKIRERRNKFFHWPGSPAAEYCYEDDQIISLVKKIKAKKVDLKDEASICDELVKYLGSYSSRDFAVAKHFFELGMTVSNKAQKGE